MSWPAIFPGDEVAAVLDQTLLRSDATESDIDRLCTEADRASFHSVCVNPCYVQRCAGILKHSVVQVSAVIGFPLGGGVADITLAEARRALMDGAKELDVVMNIGLFKSGKRAAVEAALAGIITVARESNAVTKVIIEAPLLNAKEKADACSMVVDLGADFVKTSTGVEGRNATEEDVRLIRRTVGPSFGVKAAGGIRTYDQLLTMVRAGANRIGTSSGVEILHEAHKQTATESR